MAIAHLLRKLSFLPPSRLLELYPPFFFMGVKVRATPGDYHRVRVELPLRWYGTNEHGTIFGGFMCAVSDPMPALLCAKLFPGHEVWTRSNSVEFLRPARGRIHADIHVSEDDKKAISAALEAAGKTTHVFEFSFRDKSGHEIARVKNAVYLRRAKPADR